MCQADFIDEFEDTLIHYYEHWLFDGNFDSVNQPAISDFIAWAREKGKKDLHTKRGSDNKSDFERREVLKSERNEP